MNLAETLRLSYSGNFRTDPVSGASTVQLDDRAPEDCYQGFCTINASVRPDDTVTLTLSHPPINDNVRSVVDEHGGRVIPRKFTQIVLDLPATDEAADIVRDLAAAIKSVTRRSERYLDPNWKWVVPRTTASLTQFARRLTRYYRVEKRRGRPILSQSQNGASNDTI